MFTDTHCHIYEEYYNNIDEIIKISKENGINRYINNATNVDNIKEVIELSNKFENMYAAIGIHPEDVDNFDNSQLNLIESLINNDKVIAIGEIGLDYYYTKDNKEKQIELFESQLKLAEKYDKPVIIHSREATMDTLNILKKYKLKGVIHSFSGSYETACEYIKMGYKLGINGVITFKNCNIKDVYSKLSPDNIVLETDSPYLTPVPFRGKTNNPGMVKYIAEFVSDLYGITLEELSDITNDTIKAIFDI